MANFDIPENPEYSEEVRKFEEEDPGHADLFNTVVETLLNNEAFLKKLADSLARRISELNTLTKYTTVQTPNPTIGPQIIQKESEIFDFDGNPEPFPIQEVVAGHEAALRQLNTETGTASSAIEGLKGLRVLIADLTTDSGGNAYVNPAIVGQYGLVLAAVSNTFNTMIKPFNNEFGMQYLNVVNAKEGTPYIGTFSFWILVI